MPCHGRQLRAARKRAMSLQTVWNSSQSDEKSREPSGRSADVREGCRNLGTTSAWPRQICGEEDCGCPSHVASVSRLIARDVEAGRAALNFSTWGTYSIEQQQKLLNESCEEVRDGEMPMFTYTLLHSEAKLSPTDVRAICELAPVVRR